MATAVESGSKSVRFADGNMPTPKATAPPQERPPFDHRVGIRDHIFNPHVQIPPLFYDSLHDPALQKHLSKQVYQESLLATGLIDMMHHSVVDSPHRRARKLSYMPCPNPPGKRRETTWRTFHTKEDHERDLREKELLRYRAEADRLRKTWSSRDEKVASARTPVGDCKPTARDKIFLEEAKKKAMMQKEAEEIHLAVLETEQTLKEAKRLMNVKKNSAAQKEAIAFAAKQAEDALAKTHASIAANKEASVKLKERLAEDREDKRKQSLRDSERAKLHMERVFLERKQEQDALNLQRAKQREEEMKIIDAANKKREEEAAMELAKAKQSERVQLARVRKEQYEEEMARKERELMEKKKREASQKAFEERQANERRINKENADKDRKQREADQALLLEQQRREIEEKQRKALADRKEREEKKAQLDAQKKAQLLAEQEATKAEMVALMEAKRLAAEEEQARIIAEMEAQEKTRLRAERAAAKMEAERQAQEEKDRIKEEKRKQVEAEKAAADAEAKEQLRIENMRKARAEMERKIAYMSKYGV